MITHKPEMVFVAGCNAAGKSTFIRTRLNELEDFEVFMTDVYKGRTKELVKRAIEKQRGIVIESVFNDASFKDLVDLARSEGYKTSLIALFLDSLQQSVSRVALRGMQQSGITISGGNIKINFNESFKNLATYFMYFDSADFIYTGANQCNKLIMSFKHSKLVSYSSNELMYPKKWANYSFHKDRLRKKDYDTIMRNKDFVINSGNS